MHISGKENNKLQFEDFIKVDEETAIKYDFLRNGGEPDECLLSRRIYKAIYPWYNKKDFRGDTMNTYRKLIRYKCKKFYSQLCECKQEKVTTVIQKYTNHDVNEFRFEYEKKSDSGNIFNQISNNYQLGNFCVFPQGKINRARSFSPYNDYFDRFLEEIKNYYDDKDNMKRTTTLQKEIFMCSDYFDSFLGFDDYISKNYFDDFIEDGEIIKLFIDGFDDSFENYVKLVNEIIQKRGKRIFAVLEDSHMDK